MNVVCSANILVESSSDVIHIPSVSPSVAQSVTQSGNQELRGRRKKESFSPQGREGGYDRIAAMLSAVVVKTPSHILSKEIGSL